MRIYFAAAAIAALSASPSIAQDAPSLELAAGVPVKLAVAEEVNSGTHKAGQNFRLTVMEDVLLNRVVVIPRGTPGTAEITYRTGKGAFGKSGKLEFDLRSIELGGKVIPVSGQFLQEGEGNTVATGVGIVAVGVFAAFITGKAARLPVGRELLAQTSQAVPFDADGKLSASFDSDAAVAAAEAKSPIGQCKAKARMETKKAKQEQALKTCYAKRLL